MCLFRARGTISKGIRKVEYGILAHNLEEDSEIGTCLMEDGRYETLGWNDLDKSFRRILEIDNVLNNVDEKLLRDLFNEEMMDVLSMEEKIETSQILYRQQNTAAIEARLAKQAERSKTLLKTKANKKCTLKDIQLQTNVAMYFHWGECGLVEKPSGKLRLKKKCVDKDGEYRTGTVIGKEQNKFRHWIFTCVFDTPQKFEAKFNSNEIKAARDHYVRLEDLNSGNESSSNTEDSSMDDSTKGPEPSNTIPIQQRRTKKQCSLLIIKETQEDTCAAGTNDTSPEAKTHEPLETLQNPQEKGQTESECASTNVTLGARLDNGEVVPQDETNSSGTQDTSPEAKSHEQLEILQKRPEKGPTEGHPPLF